MSVDNRFSWSSPVVDSHRLRCSQSCFQEESRNKWRNKENETVPGAKNVQEKTTARLQLKLMVHVEGIRLDGSDLPRIIVYNHVTHSVCVCVCERLPFFLTHYSEVCSCFHRFGSAVAKQCFTNI